MRKIKFSFLSVQQTLPSLLAEHVHTSDIGAIGNTAVTGYSSVMVNLDSTYRLPFVDTAVYNPVS
jgi:hypothetical protein